MGLFSIFKKKKKETEPEIKKLGFSEIEDFLNEKLNQNKEKEKQVLDLIKQKIEFYTNEINQKLETLRNFDINTKKARQRVKSIVDENKEKYIKYVERLIDEFNNIEINDLSNIMKESDQIFDNLHKKSYTNYEKATILIGKEMGEVKKSIKNFSKELIRIFNENQKLTNEIKTINEIKQKLNKYNVIKKELENINQSIEYFNGKIRQNEKEKQELKQKIQEIKETKEYKENLEKKQKIQSFGNDLEKTILNMKQYINFKELANFFHVFPEKIKKVKEYKDNFLKKFKEDKQEIISLLEESGLKSKSVSEKLEKIREIQENIQKLREEVKDDETEKCYDKIEQKDSEIQNLEKQKQEKEKRKQTLEMNKKEIHDSLISNLNKVGVELKENLE